MENKKIILCSNCFTIPLIDYVINNNNILIKLNCPCENDKLYQIYSFIDKYIIDLSNINCNFPKRNLHKKKALFVSISKKIYFCNECADIHKKSDPSDKLINLKELQFTCFKHNNLINGYCEFCKINICKNCEYIHMVKNHSILLNPNKLDYIFDYLKFYNNNNINIKYKFKELNLENLELIGLYIITYLLKKNNSNIFIGLFNYQIRKNFLNFFHNVIESYLNIKINNDVETIILSKKIIEEKEVLKINKSVSFQNNIFYGQYSNNNKLIFITKNNIIKIYNVQKNKIKTLANKYYSFSFLDDNHLILLYNNYADIYDFNKYKTLNKILLDDNIINENNKICGINLNNFIVYYLNAYLFTLTDDGNYKNKIIFESDDIIYNIKKMFNSDIYLETTDKIYILKENNFNIININLLNKNYFKFFQLPNYLNSYDKIANKILFDYNNKNFIYYGCKFYIIKINVISYQIELIKTFSKFNNIIFDWIIYDKFLIIITDKKQIIYYDINTFEQIYFQKINNSSHKFYSSPNNEICSIYNNHIFIWEKINI